MTFARQDATDFAQDFVRLGFVLERVRQQHRVDANPMRSRANRCANESPRGRSARSLAMPREHGFALRARLGDQPIVVAPQTDLQQLPAEHLRQRLAGELALERVDALAERRAQPSVQVAVEGRAWRKDSG